MKAHNRLTGGFSCALFQFQREFDATGNGERLASPRNIEDSNLMGFRSSAQDMSNQPSDIINVHILHAISQVLLTEWLHAG
jgi:hypothetical protein